LAANPLKLSPESTMAVLVLPTSPFVERQLAALRALAPAEVIFTDPASAPPDEIEAILAFRLAAGIAARFAALRFVACAGAGVDEVLATPDLAPHVPIVRAVDPRQGVRMAQYVALMALRHYRALPRLEAQQRDARWTRPPPASEADFPVGVMGFGSVGAPVVDVLLRLGFSVVVWTRSPHAIEGAVSFAGADGLPPFLARSRILVCALPLTPATRGLVDAPALSALPRGAYVINVSRGRVLAEADLVDAIDAGHVAGAALDVFETEPLPADSRLWRHPNILCTPHIAAEPRPEVAAAQFAENLRRARGGLPLLNQVDRARGY
jgi:D-3-phosphoglycerate dehydrogenase/glyoxylate/hydroxypyruvate reductase A